MKSIVYVGLGALGRMIVADLAQRARVNIAAVVDPAPSLAGRRLGEIVPGAPDIRIVPSLSDVDLSAVQGAVVTTHSQVDRCMESFRPLLEAGCPITSTCEELVWPGLRHAALATELDALARRAGVAVLGTGVNPGFLMDTVPLMATSVCRRVDSVEVERIQDATTRRIPFQAKIGVAMSHEDFRRRMGERSMGHAGLAESLHFLAGTLGFRIDAWDEDWEAVVARADMDTALGRVAAGQPCGVRQVATGSEDGRQVLRLTFQAAVGQADPRDRVIVHGDPDLDLRFDGGVHGDTATVAIVTNSLRVVLDAPAGLHTMATVPPPGCWRSA